VAGALNWPHFMCLDCGKRGMLIHGTCESCGSIAIALVVFRRAESGLSAELVVAKCKTGVAKRVNL